MSALRAILSGALAVALLGACQAGEATSPQPTDSAGAAATASPASTPAQTEPSSPTDAPEPEPTTDPGSFTCDLPVVIAPTVAVANIVDVRVGEHAGHDRVVFEFEQGIPETTIDRAEPPFFESGSGFEFGVDGDAFLALVMRGGSKQTDAGTSSYEGPREFEPGFTALRHLVEGGDFERQSTWVFGLAEDTCVNVVALDDPPRLVIDLQH